MLEVCFFIYYLWALVTSNSLKNSVEKFSFLKIPSTVSGVFVKTFTSTVTVQNWDAEKLVNCQFMQDTTYWEPLLSQSSVSYTHLDVYKRQVWS